MIKKQKSTSSVGKNNIEIVSFFSGSGFLDLGLEKSGFDVVYVNEYYKPFIEAYKYSRKQMGMPEPKCGYSTDSVETFLGGSNGNYLKEIVNKAKSSKHLIGFIGGPPCPDFSVGGKNKGHTGENGKLSGTYANIIINNKPDFFVFENVKGLWRTKRHRAFYDSLKAKFKKHGYILHDKLVNAISYGAPQNRERIILFGVREDILKKNGESIEFLWDKYAVYPDREAFDYPWPSSEKFKNNSEKKPPKNIPLELTVEYWFKENKVDKHPNKDDFFFPRAALAKFKVIPEGDDSKKSCKRLHRWRYSPTACYGNNEVHLHPYLERRISAAEALSIQSLPKEFILPKEMTLSDKFKTIGNGVPYKLALGIAKTIDDYLREVVK